MPFKKFFALANRPVCTIQVNTSIQVEESELDAELDRMVGGREDYHASKTYDAYGNVVRTSRSDHIAQRILIQGAYRPAAKSNSSFQ